MIDKEKTCTACSGAGYYCGRACGACDGTGLEYSKDDIIEALENELKQLQNTSSNSDYAKCNQPKPSLCEKRKTVVYCTHDKDCTFKHFA